MFMYLFFISVVGNQKHRFRWFPGPYKQLRRQRNYRQKQYLNPSLQLQLKQRQL